VKNIRNGHAGLAERSQLDRKSICFTNQRLN